MSNRLSLSRFFELAKWTISLTLSAALVACGGSGGGSAGVDVANADLSAPVNAARVAGLVPAPGGAPMVFAFAGGFSGVDGTGAPVALAGATTVAFTNSGGATPGFTITNGGNTASGNTSFGSCIFTVTASTFPEGTPLALGAVFTVDPCTMTINTNGTLANGTTNTLNVTLIFGATSSTPLALLVTISSGGVVSVNGVVIGTVTITPVTGATGAGG